MRRFFRKMSETSVTYAKNRLKSVINSDRINVSQNKTLEKIRKEVTAVLLKYSKEQMTEVSVSCPEGATYVLTAQFKADMV